MNLTPLQKAAAIKPLFRVALSAIDSLSQPEKADLFEAIAIAAEGVDEELRAQAASTASTLRDAETAQMTFALLVNRSA